MLPSRAILRFLARSGIPRHVLPSGAPVVEIPRHAFWTPAFNIPDGQTMRTHITAETLLSVESFHVATGRKNAYSIEETTSIHVRFVVLLKRGTQTRLKDGRHLR